MPNPSTACRLTQRGVLRITSKDRATFLQGLISNDIGLCTPEKPLFAALLTPQGKFLHELFVFAEGDAFLIDCKRATAADLLKKLNSYKLRADVVIEDVSDAFAVWAVWDVQSNESGGAPLPLAGFGTAEAKVDLGVAFATRVGGGLSPQTPQREVGTSPPSVPPASGREAGWAPDPRLASLGMRGIFPVHETPSGVTITDETAYDHLRLSLGVTDGRDMIAGKSTLLDGNFDLLNGISWTKGCYVGQELTARMHHRALVKKRMFPVRISGAAPEFGALIYANGVEIGDMRTAQNDVGLALLNIEQAKETICKSGTLDCGDAQLTPHQPDWLKI